MGMIHRPTSSKRARALLRRVERDVLARAVVWREALHKADEICVSLDMGEDDYTSTQFDAAMEALDQLTGELREAVDLLVEAQREYGRT